MNRLLQFHRRIALAGPARLFEWFVFLLLLPFSVIYGFVGWLRNKCYDWKICSCFRAAVPVVSVGNLAAGGTGKTPVVDWLVKEFLQRGKTPAIISRGYGGAFSDKVGIVSKGDGPLLDAGESGDEPFLLARRNPEALVLISRKRADGIRVAVDELGADIIILDDGFQHRAVHRDLDLVLLDSSSPCGNRWPLPAGLLREFPKALDRADILLLTRSNANITFSFGQKPVFYSRHCLANFAIGLNGEEVEFRQLKKLKLFAFAGIADPNSFFSGLKGAGLALENDLSLSDHCSYDQKLRKQIMAAANGCDALITTEKDAVKLVQEMFSIPCYQVPMQIVMTDEDVFKAQIQQYLWSR